MNPSRAVPFLPLSRLTFSTLLLLGGACSSSPSEGEAGDGSTGGSSSGSGGSDQGDDDDDDDGTDDGNGSADGSGSTTDDTDTDADNEAPRAGEDVYLTHLDEPLTVDAGEGVLGNDVDPDADDLTASFDGETSVAGGTVTLESDGSLSYAPLAGWWGEDEFSYTVHDGRGGEATGRVRIVVRPQTAPLSSVATGVGGFGIDGEAAADTVGASAAAAGDVNGDGLADLVLGAPQASPGGTALAGRAYVVFGRSNHDVASLADVSAGTGGFAIDGEAAADGAGFAVAGAGDVNADGLDDILVAAPNGNAGTGRVYVIFGRTGGDLVALADVAAGTGGFAIDGELGVLGTELSVDGAGDVDGDGLDDVVIGLPNANGSAGRAYVVFGKSDTATVALADVVAGTGGFAIDGESALDEAGISVSGAGDVDGDGQSDIVLGAPRSSASGNANAGRTYVVFGKAGGGVVSLSNVAAGTGGFAIDGEAATDLSGSSVRGAGDVDGDGLDDIVLSAPNGNASAGRAYVVFGRSGGAVVSLADVTQGTGGFVLDGEPGGSAAGLVVGAAGDIDADGLADLLVGAPDAAPGGRAAAGRSYFVFGKADTTPVALLDIAAGTGGFALDGESSVDASATAISGGGDVNGDGIDDVIVGAPRSSASGLTNAGRGYVLFGGDFTLSTTFRGTPSDDAFTGTSEAEILVGGLGNDALDGAGGHDSLLGAPGDDVLTLVGDDYGRVDGGPGQDTLMLPETLDLTTTPGTLRSIETIDFTGARDNTLGLHLSDVLSLSETGTLTVRGDAGDAFVADLTGAGFTRTNDVDFALFTNDRVQLRVAAGVDVSRVLY